MSQNPFQPPSDDSLPVRARATSVDPETARQIGERIKRLNRNSLLLGVTALVIQGVSGGLPQLIRALVVLATTGLLIYALSLYARMRNQSPWWGAFGLLSCLGFLILFFLPKKCHYCAAKTNGKTCAQCGAPAPL
ncbi:MAG TPA: hypothetical protein VMS65_05935 [Polyangiaceae bacterium]|nr:hypothetical protein [Polyangiaceae bacterium]